MIHRSSAIRRLASVAIPYALVSFLLACGGGGGGGGNNACTTCPPPVTDGTLRVSIQFDDAAKSGLQPAGFRLSDVDHIELSIAGAPTAEQILQPGQDKAIFDLTPGSYSISAKAVGDNELALFTASQDFSITLADTADVTLAMNPALGAVTLTVDGQSSGAVTGTAGEGVPFTVTVKNTQGAPVPDAAVVLKTTASGYGQVLFDGGNATGSDGTVHGTITAPYHGALDLSMTVDGRTIASPGPTHVEFVTGVDADKSAITQFTPTGTILLANGKDAYAVTVQIRNASGQPLPDVPVTVASNRNVGVEPDVDLIEPQNGYASRTTDATGLYRFRIRSNTSSFLQLNGEGVLTAEGNDGRFLPSTIQIFADGVPVDQRAVSFNSTVDPANTQLTTSKQFVTANGQDSAVLIVTAQNVSMFGDGPAKNAYVEIIDNLGHTLNEDLAITPEPGYNGFRTDASGEWRGRIRSSTAKTVFLKVRVDGRSATIFPRSIIFR